MQLIKDRITVRDFKEEDIQKKVEIINDSNNNKFLHYDLPLEYDKTLNWFNTKNNNNRLDCTICYNEDVCGFIGLLQIDKKNKKAEYYICVDHNFSGNGIGTTSSEMLIKYAFDELDINKVYLYTEEDNRKAQHLFEKIGFQQEGFLKNDIIFNDRNINRYMYAVCKEN